MNTMSKTSINPVLFITSLLFITICTGCLIDTLNETNKENAEGTILVKKIHAPSLDGNILDDSAEQSLLVYLPPSYYEHLNRRYPVIYFLHGFNEELDNYLNGTYFKLKSEMDLLIHNKVIKETIIVILNGSNKLKCSFYWNSVVTGRWEDYIVNDVINYTDANFRTLAVRESRGIAGYSMGGFGALTIAMLHPEKFSALYCLSAAIVDSGGIVQAIRTWNNYNIPYVKEAYGSAFAPDKNSEYPYADIPELTGDSQDNLVLEKWEEGLGNWEKNVKKYRDNFLSYNAIRIEAGKYDEFRWIPAGNKYLAKLFEENGIYNEFELFDGAHETHVSKQIKNSMLPFFSNNLNY
jgi:S-formylglutathione hydrolase